MVGIVVVSHSMALAEGVVTLAREMASPELLIEAAGGYSDVDPGALGTDAERVRGAIERVMSADGVLVLMDLGSALMSAELASELLEAPSGPVRLSAAPLVEGAVAAAVAASGGESLEEVEAEARGALAMKSAQVGVGSGPPAAADGEDLAAELGEGHAAELGEGVERGEVTAELAVTNEIGLHARPAARFVETVSGFDAEVLVRKAGPAGTAAVSARSLTNLVALSARRGDVLEVRAGGPQAREVIEALGRLAAEGFGDGAAASAATGAADRPVDTVTQATSNEQQTPATPKGRAAPEAQEAPAVPDTPAVPEPGTVLAGVPACAGVAIGQARRIGGGPAGPPPERRADSLEAERERLERGLARVRERVLEDRDRLRARGGSGQAEIFDAHLALLEDVALLGPAREAIEAGAAAELAIHRAAAEVAQVYRGLDDPLLAERAADVLDVGSRVVVAITGDEAGDSDGAAAGVIVADELTPSQSAKLDPARVEAIATARGSATAHAAIIARALGIPAVVGLGPAILAVPEGLPLLLDGEAGTVTVAPGPAAVAVAAERRERLAERAAVALGEAAREGALAGGERIEIFANIGGAGETAHALAQGAEGVGMLRTEFLYLDRPELPDEQAQYENFREIAQSLGGRPLIIRTLDAGADKPLPALSMPPEQNPFLGVRGIRVGLADPEAVLIPQLRAALRVAAEFPVKLMMPMVATVGEVIETRRLIDRARRELGVDAPMEIGITLEVPSAALMAEQLAEHLDFFSLGTNDLTQYTMAAERGDARLASLLAPPQPAVLRLVKLVVEGAGAGGAARGGAAAGGAAAGGAAAGAGCWVGVCGEMAGDPASAILLVGLGVTELSMAPGLIPAIKQTLRSVTLEAAQRAATEALSAPDGAAARACALALL